MGAEIGGGIAAGLARGLANVFLNKRQQDTDAATRKESRNAQINLALLPHILEHAQSYDEVAPFIDQIVSGTSPSKKGKPGEHHDVLSTLLSPFFAQKASTTETPSQPSSPEDHAAVAPDTLPRTSTVRTTMAPPKRETLMGVPMLSDEEYAAKQGAMSTAGFQSKLQAQIDGAVRVLPILQKHNPEATMKDALEYVSKGTFPTQHVIAPRPVGKTVGGDELIATGKPVKDLSGAAFTPDEKRGYQTVQIQTPDGFEDRYIPAEIAGPKSYKLPAGETGQFIGKALLLNGIVDPGAATPDDIKKAIPVAQGLAKDSIGDADRLRDITVSLRDLQKQNLEGQLADLPTADDVQQNARSITVGGKTYQFINKGEYSGARAQNAASKAAQKSGVIVVTPQEVGQLSAAQGGLSNLDAMFAQIKSKLPADAQGRPLATVQNKLSTVFQTDDDLAAFRSWNLEAFQLLRSLQDTGRISNAAFQEAIVDRPQINDTVGVASKKLDNLKKLITNSVNPILQRGGSKAPQATAGAGFPVTYAGKDGKPVTKTFSTQADADVFSRAAKANGVLK